jgi:NAD(P)-dependent dehydrogenase (short-subunit alcohol dehydrogenase family)
MTVLRPELLQGCRLALAGAVPQDVATGLAGLGARVESLDVSDRVSEEEVGRWARERLPLRALVYDARSAFGDGGRDALIETMREAWSAVREVAVGALIDSPEPGKVVLIGPAPDAGPHAGAAAAALENLARTLSVEWARYDVSTVMVAAGPGASEADLLELVGFLCSQAGEYFSGCRLELSSPRR